MFVYLWPYVFRHGWMQVLSMPHGCEMHQQPRLLPVPVSEWFLWRRFPLLPTRSVILPWVGVFPCIYSVYMSTNTNPNSIWHRDVVWNVNKNRIRWFAKPHGHVSHGVRAFLLKTQNLHLGTEGTNCREAVIVKECIHFIWSGPKCFWMNTIVRLP